MAISGVLKGDDRPTMGLLIFKDRDSVLARSVMESFNRPICVSDYSELTTEELYGSLFAFEEAVTELRGRNQFLLRNL